VVRRGDGAWTDADDDDAPASATKSAEKAPKAATKAPPKAKSVGKVSPEDKVPGWRKRRSVHETHPSIALGGGTSHSLTKLLVRRVPVKHLYVVFFREAREDEVDSAGRPLKRPLRKTTAPAVVGSLQ
jgi:hypothetical protein